MACASNLQMNWLPLQTRKGGPLGLKNLGNSCYLNSVLQCLTYTPPLANFCLLNHHSSSCTFMNGSSNSVCPFCLVEKQISHSLSVDSVSESPTRIHSFLTSFAKHFRQGWQEDAHEFLRYVIEACNGVCVKLHKLLAASKLRTRQDSHKISKEEPHTVVKEIFGGVLQSQVRCLSCNAESNKLDDIMDLSLDVFKTSSVREAMCRYFQPEVLDGSNKYKCEKCRKVTAARKQMSVCQAPNVLVIQLKRFENIYGGKIDRYIRFDEQLDLHGHMCCKSQDQRPEYFLYAAIVHAGYSQDSGHYYSYVKDINGKWYCCNDAHVTSVTAKSVLLEKAYILFYVRHTTKASAKGSEGSRNDIWTGTLPDKSKLGLVKSQEPSLKANVATKKSSGMTAVGTQEPASKANGFASSICAAKGEGAQPVRFNIVKPGSHNQVQKSLSGGNGRAGISLMDLGQAKRLPDKGVMSNGSLEFFNDSKNDHSEFEKQEQKQKLCASAGNPEQVSNSNGSNHSELVGKSIARVEQMVVVGNGDNVSVPSTVKKEGTKPDPENVPSSCNGVSQLQQAVVQPSQENTSWCSSVDEIKKMIKIEGRFANGGVKRKVPNGSLVDPTLKENDHSQGMIGGLKRKAQVLDGFLVDQNLRENEHSQDMIGEAAAANQPTLGEGLPAEESDIQSLKLWLATDCREWLLQSGWCDTVRNSFRELKKARLSQDCQFVGGKAESLRSDAFASAHDSLRQKVPRELKEHLVKQLHAHFAV